MRRKVRRVWSLTDWNRKELKVIRFLPTLILFPLSLFASILYWISEFIEYTIVEWLDNRVEDTCWYYLKVRKKLFTK